MEILEIILLCYIIYCINRKENKETENEETEKDEQKSFQKVIPEYLHKMCEITVKDPLVRIDIMFSVKGILTDIDEEWVMLEVKEKKKNVFKIFRIDNINSIKEVLD
ncbi:MAG: hypothetical protein IKJ01_08005 [Lachnospiraceae bacterium]|nr:hypothetical protein [Lachnospiraceae bacterium]